MRTIFISYRRDDSMLMVDRLVDHLRSVYGNEVVFHDVDSVQGGQDFRQEINNSMREAKVFLLVIGPQWLSATKDGRRRLDDPLDTVRVEIESAYRYNVPIIPVLVQDAKIPGKDEVPESISQLIYLNALTLRSGQDFHADFNALVTAINRLMPARSARRPRWVAPGALAAIAVVVLAVAVIITGFPLSVLEAHGGIPLPGASGTTNGAGTKTSAAKMSTLIPSNWHESDDPLQDNSKGYHWDETTYFLYSCQFTSSGYAVQGSIDAYCLAHTATEFTDYAFQVDAQMSISTGGGIVFHDSTNGGYYFTVVNMNGTQVMAYVKSFDANSTYTTLKTIDLTALNVPFNKAGTDYNELGVLAKGNTYTCFVNGVEVAQVSDSSYPQGFMGIGGGYYHDRIYVATFARNAQIWTP